MQTNSIIAVPKIKGGVKLYGHNPPPELTDLEIRAYSFLTKEWQSAQNLLNKLEGVSSESLSVALVRLRNRGMVEDMKPGGKWKDGKRTHIPRMWRRIPSQEDLRHALLTVKYESYDCFLVPVTKELFGLQFPLDEEGYSKDAFHIKLAANPDGTVHLQFKKQGD